MDQSSSGAVSFWQTSGPAQKITAWMVALGMIVVVGSALAFEHFGGYAPCALCLEQRNPYYWGIPFALVGAVSASLAWPACLTRGMLIIAFLCLVTTALMGAYHAGVEWGWFPAPATCGAGISATSSDAGGLLDSLSNAKAPACDAAAGRFLGVSFAGWNFLAAALLAAIAWRGAFGRSEL